MTGIFQGNNYLVLIGWDVKVTKNKNVKIDATLMIEFGKFCFMKTKFKSTILPPKQWEILKIL